MARRSRATPDIRSSLWPLRDLSARRHPAGWRVGALDARSGDIKSKDQAGLTLIELAVALAIMGLIMVPVIGIINQLIFVPAQWSATTNVLTSARNAVRWVAEDARQATSYTPGVDPEYGTFSWTDRVQFPVNVHSVRYYHASSTSSLMREETIDGDSRANLVAPNIQAYADVSIKEIGRLVTASVTSSADAIRDTITHNTVIKAQMRPVHPVAQPAPPPLRLAWDDFEGGTSGGGSGWLADWSVVGAASVTSEDTPLEGAYHLRLIGTTGEGSLFAFRGDNTDGFWSYLPGTDTWTLLANAPATVNGGGSLAWDEGDHVYALRGDNSKDLWRYVISADTWETLDDTPGRVDDGGALIYTDGLLYAFRGNDRRDFWRYDPGTDSWTVLADAPGAVNAGGSLAWDEAGYIYALRGDDSSDFWRYAIGAGTWEVLDDTPERVNDGGALSHADGLLYAFRGDGQRDLWRYDIDAGGWVSRPDTPRNVAWGGALAWDRADTIYAFRGDDSDDLWTYTISTDSWATLADAPESVRHGGSLAYAAPTAASRSVDLSGLSDVRLQLSAKASGFGPGDSVVLSVSSDGAVFTPVRTWADGDDDDGVYRLEDIDLSSFSMTGQFFIAFDTDLSTPAAKLLVDDLEFVRTWRP